MKLIIPECEGQCAKVLAHLQNHPHLDPHVDSGRWRVTDYVVIHRTGVECES